MALPEHRRLQHAAVRAEARAQRALFAGDCAASREGFCAAVDLYRRSYEVAPPGATGRLIGMLKASVIGGCGEATTGAYAEPRLEREDDDPAKAYALAICRLIATADDALRPHVDGMADGSPPFERAAAAIAAIADRATRSYADAVTAIVRDFENRRHHVTKVPIADTALMLELFAERRGMAVWPSSPLLPTPCRDSAGATPNRD